MKLVSFLPFILALFAAGIYLYTASPATMWLDAGRIVAGNISWGITNPSDPAYHPIAYLFGLLPIGSYVFRLQIFAALMAAVTLVLVYKLTMRILEEQSGKLFKILAAVVSLFSLAFCYQFWSQAQNIETFIMVGMLSTIILTLILWPTNSQEGFLKKMTGIVLTFGIASGTNPIIMSMMPSSLLLMWTKRKFLNDINLFWLALLGAATIALVYLYLPIRAQQHPFVNWYYIREWSDLYTLATGADLNIFVPELDRINGFTGSPEVFWRSTKNYFRMLVSSFTVWLLPLMVLGAFWLYRNSKRRIFWFLALVPVTNLIFAGLYKSGNQESWFIVSYVVLSIFVGLGYFYLAQLLQKIRDGRYIAVGLALICLLPLITLWPILNRHEWALSNDYIENLYRPVQPPAIIYGSGDNYDSLSYYAYEVLKPKPNVIPLTDNLLFLYTWYRDNLRVNTDLKFPEEPDPEADPTVEYNRFLNEFFELNLPKYKIYVTQVALRNKLSISPDGKGTMKLDKRFKLIPRGLLMEVVPKEASATPDLAHFDFKFHGPGFPNVKPTYLEEVYTGEMRGMTNEYGFSHYSLAEYFYREGKMDLAEEYFAKSQEFSPGNVEMFEEWEKLKNPESTKSASVKIKPSTGFQLYEDPRSKLTFSYPVVWWVEEIPAGFKLNEPEGQFTVEIKMDIVDKGEKIDDLMAKAKETYGTLQNQGPAKLPNWDEAKVKVWQDGKTPKLQFFLVKGSKYLKVLVTPSNSKLMKQFDEVIGSLQFFEEPK